MATQVKTLDAVYLRNEKSEILRIDDVDSPTPLRTPTSPWQLLNSEIWVGYCSKYQHLIDKIKLPGNAEGKLHGLHNWWESLIPGWMRFVYCFVFCLRPSVFIGTLPFASQEKIARQDFPHRTQSNSLEKSEPLTRAFYNPSSLVDDASYFEQRPSFYAASISVNAQESRKVLCLGCEIDKRYLAYPFLGGLSIATIIAVLISAKTQNIATGAQVGGSLCGIVAAVFCYVVWRCS